MTQFFRPWIGATAAVAVATMVVAGGLRNAFAQEHHQPPPIVTGEHDDNPFHTTERGERERPRTEREVLEHQIHALELALPALREGERRDAMEIVERAIAARRVTLAGRRDDEAHQIRERAPRPEQLAEALILASRLWREFNNAEKAHAVGQLAEELRRPRDRERERPREQPESRARRDVPREHGSERDALARIERLEQAVREMQVQLREMRRVLGELTHQHEHAERREER